MQPNYTHTKLKAWFRRLLRYPARKRTTEWVYSTLAQTISTVYDSVIKVCNN